MLNLFLLQRLFKKNRLEGYYAYAIRVFREIVSGFERLICYDESTFTKDILCFPYKQFKMTFATF